jgi:hypothetical protein
MKNKSIYPIIGILIGISLVISKALSIALGKKKQNEILPANTTSNAEIPDMALGGYNQSYLDLFNPFSFTSNFSVDTAKRTTRGFRNNNPGNLIFVPTRNWHGRKTPRTDTKFDQFVELPYGVSAMLKVLAENIDAGKTLKELIYKYAPPSENNTASYLNSATKKVGLSSADSKMNRTHLKSLTITLIQLENSTTISDAEYGTAFELFNQHYA